MTISYQADNKIAISSKNRTILVGSEVRLEDYLVPGAGEYDIAGIQCEAHNLPEAVAYFIRSEDLTVTFLSSIDEQVTKLDDASSTNILVVDIQSNNKPSDLKPIIKSLEPSYLFLIGIGATPEFCQGLDLPQQDSASLKVSHTSLPEEGTFLVAKK